MAANPKGLEARVRTPPVATICFLFHAARMASPSGGYIAAIVFLPSRIAQTHTAGEP
jgi:hypothetical protein